MAGKQGKKTKRKAGTLATRKLSAEKARAIKGGSGGSSNSQLFESFLGNGTHPK